MDANRFDAFVSAIAAPPRRGVLRGALGLGIAALLSGAGFAEPEAKKRRKKKKCRGASKAKCGGRCIDVATDPANCGACGTNCGPGQCVNGTCVCQGVNITTCSGQCVNLATDANNCGECGLVCESGECVNGACTCNNSQSQCLTGCACANRLGGGKVCFKGGNNGIDCNSDSDCPFRSLCFSISKCSVPCVA